MNGQEKVLLAATDQSKFYSGDCYIFQYSYPGEDREEHLIGTWIGNNSVEVKDLYYFIHILLERVYDDLFYAKISKTGIKIFV